MLITDLYMTLRTLVSQNVCSLQTEQFFITVLPDNFVPFHELYYGSKSRVSDPNVGPAPICSILQQIYSDSRVHPENICRAPSFNSLSLKSYSEN